MRESSAPIILSSNPAIGSPSFVLFSFSFSLGGGSNIPTFPLPRAKWRKTGEQIYESLRSSKFVNQELSLDQIYLPLEISPDNDHVVDGWIHATRRSARRLLVPEAPSPRSRGSVRGSITQRSIEKGNGPSYLITGTLDETKRLVEVVGRWWKRRRRWRKGEEGRGRTRWRKRRWTLRNRGVIRGVDASIARRTAQLTRLPPTSRSVLSRCSLSRRPRTHDPEILPPSPPPPTSYPLSLSLLYFFFLERVRARERARENASGRMGGLRWPTSSKMWGVDLAQRRSPDPFPLSRLEIVSIRTSPFKSRLKFAPLEMIKDDGQSDGSNPRRSPFFLLRFSCESFCELIKNHWTPIELRRGNGRANDSSTTISNNLSLYSGNFIRYWWLRILSYREEIGW